MFMQFARLKSSQPIEGFGCLLIDRPTLACHYLGVIVRESQVRPRRRTVYHQVAWRRKLWVPLFAVVAVTACWKAPAPQSEPAPGSIRSTPRPAPETTEAERAKFQANLLVLERDTPELTDFPESSLSPATRLPQKSFRGRGKLLNSTRHVGPVLSKTGGSSHTPSRAISSSPLAQVTSGLRSNIGSIRQRAQSRSTSDSPAGQLGPGSRKGSTN